MTLVDGAGVVAVAVAGVVAVPVAVAVAGAGAPVPGLPILIVFFGGSAGAAAVVASGVVAAGVAAAALADGVSGAGFWVMTHAAAARGIPIANRWVRETAFRMVPTLYAIQAQISPVMWPLGAPGTSS
jgi:hypothetical protein